MTPQIEMSDSNPPVQEEVARLAGLPEVRAAFDWFRSQEAQFVEWQMESARIAAPPFGEAARGAWLAERFRELGLGDVQADEVGNVFGVHPGYGRRSVALSAHIDTVFPATTPLNIRQQGSRLYGPGVADNGAGIAALLAVAGVIRVARISHALPFVFIGNVGEEGEGDLRGMRHVFTTPRWRDSIAYSVIVDGAGSDTVVAEALGSRRFEVIVRGPGGHSWSDFGAPNPIIVLARALEVFRQTPVPASPKTTFNVGVIRGGTSVNSIPESASMRVDLRSTSMAEIDRLDHALRVAVDQAIEAENRAAAGHGKRKPPGVQSEVVAIGNRPAGELAADTRILKVIRAVDAQLGNAAQVQRASTDANIPLSLGREAIAIGGGGSGGGAHTLQEWFDANGRDLGLRRILLTMLALSGVGE
ncbi:MAG: M20/M25/M40 family metallo-hydrolase [Acidobacteriia bacterium]|nr:M20/M25/M40 family metallo-hydrolase [Terriglobia bacterium]